jgi:hypothetical protein
MLNIRSLALAGALATLPQMGHAAADVSRCVDVSVAKKAIEARNGRWVELTSDQWQFLRGIYAMNPLTKATRPALSSLSMATRRARQCRLPTSCSP